VTFSARLSAWLGGFIAIDGCFGRVPGQQRRQPQTRQQTSGTANGICAAWNEEIRVCWVHLGCIEGHDQYVVLQQRLSTWAVANTILKYRGIGFSKFAMLVPTSMFLLSLCFSCGENGRLCIDDDCAPARTVSGFLNSLTLLSIVLV